MTFHCRPKLGHVDSSPVGDLVDTREHFLVHKHAEWRSTSCLPAGEA